VWGRVPAEWKEGIIVSLYNGKGSQFECSSYRPISLLSVSGKVFAHILLACIQPLLDKFCRPQQSGFTARRSTMDAILALRLLAELHQNFSRELHVACIDIKSAFDSVDMVALWKALRGSGMPPFLLQLICDLHTCTTSRVRTPQGMSDVFYTTSGVRQGCILAPALFCCAIDWLMRHCSGCFGVDVGSISISPSSTTLMTQSFLPIIQRNGTVFRNFEASAGVISTQTGIKRRSKILELEKLQEQSILTIKQ